MPDIKRTAELVEEITHLAFYAGWPSAITAATALQRVLGDTGRSQ